MRIFHCDACHTAVYFENDQCLNCGHQLGYVPNLADTCAIEPLDDVLWRVLSPDANGHAYRRCQNWVDHNVCNWLVPADAKSPLCQSCQLTRVIPDLSVAGNAASWYALEVAKRRLVYSLMAAGLPVAPKTAENENGLAFEFLASTPEAPVITGHAKGVITIDLAEVDDAEREKRRLALHEPYRTLLGHFRHEVGHHYWDRLIVDNERQNEFRGLFGDEREDYAAALQRHYTQGPPADWQANYVSAYCTVHPWEDWAETWAHYLHVTDTLETASECGLAVRPRKLNLPASRPRFNLRNSSAVPFDQILTDWLAVTHVLNNLNRGLGQRDAYPFVLSPPAIEKLRFVHDLCGAASRA